MTYWILYFYMYGFIGWIYESTYVSVRTRKWVNRGFLHGPLLPIYGFGGIICVLCGIITDYNLILTFISAIIICTTMELFTGLGMEKLFKVRYWNYLDYPFNYKGYICLYVSLFWGVLAIVASFFIHPIVSSYFVNIPLASLNSMITLFLLFTAFDVVKSYSEAIDLRDIYAQMSDVNSKLISIHKNIENIQQEFEVNLDEIREKITEIIDEEKVFTPFARIESSISKTKNKQIEKISKIKEKINTVKTESNEALNENIDFLQEAFKGSVNKNYSRAISIIRRNPGIFSDTYDEQKERIKELLEQYKNSK